MGLSTLVFTGFTLEALERAPRPGVESLLAETELLIDGAYDSTHPDLERNWVGSRNQRFHFLSGRYASGVERAAAYPKGLELRFENGAVVLSGWPHAKVG